MALFDFLRGMWIFGGAWNNWACCMSGFIQNTQQVRPWKLRVRIPADTGFEEMN